jgi:hypothetical protein
VTRCLRHRVGRRLRGWLSAAIPALLLIALVLPIPAGSSSSRSSQSRSARQICSSSSTSAIVATGRCDAGSAMLVTNESSVAVAEMTVRNTNQMQTASPLA